MTVNHTYGGRNTLGDFPRAAAWRGFEARWASQRGDSGTANSEKIPNTMGAAVNAISHRQLSAVIGHTLPNTPMNAIPTLADVPISPDNIGREAFDQASDANATPVGHIPPTPRQAMNRSTSSCSMDCPSAHSPPKTE